MKEISETTAKSKHKLLSEDGYVILRDFFTKDQIYNLIGK
jgi:hypothetical protein